MKAVEGYASFSCLGGWWSRGFGRFVISSVSKGCGFLNWRWSDLIFALLLLWMLILAACSAMLMVLFAKPTQKASRTADSRRKGLEGKGGGFDLVVK